MLIANLIPKLVERENEQKAMDDSFVSVAPVGADEVKSYKIHVSDSHHTASSGAKADSVCAGSSRSRKQMLIE